MRLIDADALETVITQLNENGWGITRNEYKLIDMVLFEMPTIEPEIVRCKDCKQFRRWIDTDICFCDITESEMSDDDFCSRAERRTDGV